MKCTSRERVITALEHEEPDRVPIDLGGMLSTGIMGMPYNKLKTHLGMSGGRTRIYDLRQQLAEPEIQLLRRIGGDALPVLVEEPKRWKKSRLPDNSPCEVPQWFNPEVLPDGSQAWRDDAGNIIAKMPKDGYWYDSVYHPLHNVNTIKEMEHQDPETLHSTIWSLPIVHESDINDLHERAKRSYRTTDYILMLNWAGIYEWAQDLRGWAAFLMDLAGNPEFAGALLDKLLEENIKQLEQILPAVEGYVQVVVTADDLGTQAGPQISPKLYREVVKPRHKKLFHYIKENINAYLFFHTCGDVYDFIPDFIEMGIDILNPVQVSAKDMETKRLKKKFGEDITFWGGGCDTQKVLPFGTQQDVEEEVKRRIEDLAPNGGFVFTQVHDIQANVPPENIMAMYDAVEKYGKY